MPWGEFFHNLIQSIIVFSVVVVCGTLVIWLIAQGIARVNKWENGDDY